MTPSRVPGASPRALKLNTRVPPCLDHAVRLLAVSCARFPQSSGLTRVRIQNDVCAEPSFSSSNAFLQKTIRRSLDYTLKMNLPAGHTRHAKIAPERLRTGSGQRPNWAENRRSRARKPPAHKASTESSIRVPKCSCSKGSSLGEEMLFCQGECSAVSCRGVSASVLDQTRQILSLPISMIMVHDLCHINHSEGGETTASHISILGAKKITRKSYHV
jgi:hypothetical protein